MSETTAITQVAEAAAQGFARIPPGGLYVVSLELAPASLAQIIMAQASPTEDWSLRSWLSAVPRGEALASLMPPFSALFWSLPRTLVLPVVLYTPEQTPPAPALAIAANPGTYYVNVLNLVNAAATLSFTSARL